jgi:hypothetical protein
MTDGNVHHTLPCSCGSGLSFEECCYRKKSRSAPKPNNESTALLHCALQGTKFASLEEAQQFMQEYMLRHNQTSRIEFAGLSPAEMHRVLDFPFCSPDIAAFAGVLPHEPDSPVTTIFKALAEAIGDNGLKPTAAGNLPQKVVRDIAIAVTGSDTHGMGSLRWRMNREEEYYELQITQLVAELAGLIRMFKGRFTLTKKCRTLLKSRGMAGIWPELFRAYVEKFNWEYRGGYDGLPFIQKSFLFTLYLLWQYGGEERSGNFYTCAFLQAFPAVLDQVEPRTYCSQEEFFSSMYLNTAMTCFAGFFGLAQVILDAPEPGSSSRSSYRITSLPLLRDAVSITTDNFRASL